MSLWALGHLEKRRLSGNLQRIPEGVISEVEGKPGECGVLETKQKKDFREEDDLCQILLAGEVRRGLRCCHGMWDKKRTDGSQQFQYRQKPDCSSLKCRLGTKVLRFATT